MLHQKSLLSTLIYSDHFDFPLTREELHLRLIGQKLSKVKLQQELDTLVKNKIIATDGHYYFLPNRQEVIAARNHAQIISQKKITLAHNLASKLKNIPGVVAIYLTGSLAVSNAKGNDDIDFMIITRSGRLWLTRLLLTIYTELLGVRRRPKSNKNNNHLCLNLYLTTSSLTLPVSKRSLYTAYELIQALPLYDPLHTNEHLLEHNAWLYKYLPNTHNPNTTTILPPKKSPNLLEKIAFFIELHYMQGKITKEYITKTQAFFHPHNPGESIIQELNKKFSK